jgi:hypothetical protein
MPHILDGKKIAQNLKDPVLIEIENIKSSIESVGEVKILKDEKDMLRYLAEKFIDCLPSIDFSAKYLKISFSSFNIFTSPTDSIDDFIFSISIKTGSFKFCAIFFPSNICGIFIWANIQLVNFS